MGKRTHDTRVIKMITWQEVKKKEGKKDIKITMTVRERDLKKWEIIAMNLGFANVQEYIVAAIYYYNQHLKKKIRY